MLNAAAISELETESSTYAIVDEWLKLWFDGQAHIVGANPSVLFPKAIISHGQSEMPQPMRDPKVVSPDAATVDIRVLMLPRLETAHHADTLLYTGKLITDYVVFNFWVQSQGGAKGQAQKLVQQVAQLLKAILTNPEARFPLAEKGITHLQPQAPQWLTNTGYATRMVACGAQLQYAVQFGDWVVTPPAPGGEETEASYPMTTNVPFFNEDVVTAGDYLLGDYKWPAVRVLTTATVKGMASTGADTVLEMEVGGALTGKQLTLPAGSGEVSAELALNYTLAKDTEVRWKCVSSPVDPVDQAWRVQVQMVVG